MMSLPKAAHNSRVIRQRYFEEQSRLNEEYAAREAGVEVQVEAPKPPVETKPRRFRNVGKLAKLLNMPLDVFFEIASHLHPLDILRLSRTSKEFRTMLLSRTSRHVWAAARETVVPPLPACPAHLSEPKYATIVFENLCMACGAGRSIANVDYAIPVRLCVACWRANVRKGSVLMKESKSKDIIANVLLAMPQAKPARYTPRPQREQFKNNTLKTLFYEGEFLSVVADIRTRIAQGDSEASIEAFIENRQTEAMERINFSCEMAIWDNLNVRTHRVADRDAQAERTAAIEEKLKEMGYERSDYPKGSHYCEFMMMFWQPRKLTTKIWNTIRPKLVSMLDAERKRRAAEAFTLKWQRRKKQLAIRYEEFLLTDRDDRKSMMPGFADLYAEIPSLKSLMTADDPDKDVSPEDFATIEDDLFEHAEEYLVDVRQQLADLLRKFDPTLGTKKPAVPAPAACAEESSEAEDEEDTDSSDEDTDSNDEDSESNDEDSTDSDDGPDADNTALLDMPKSLFVCTSHEYNAYSQLCLKPLSWAGFVEHWQEAHPMKRIANAHVQVARHYWEHLSRVPPALGVPDETSLSELENLARSGRPTCTCSRPEFGDLYGPNLEGDYLSLYRMLNHICSWKGPHSVTFEPFEPYGDHPACRVV
ncbi:hypothetical protein C2E23DRAFT_552119 [Lenzites betulinus]|nr:hypothetical protein C2E23DRAFT_552119 [Lenzites betulinus]